MRYYIKFKRNYIAKLVGIAILLLTIKDLSAQRLTTNDSIRLFYDSTFKIMENSYLYKDSIDWKQIKPYIYQEALKENNFEASLKAFSIFVDTVGDSHSHIIYQGNPFGNLSVGNFGESDFNESWLAKYTSGVGFEIKVVDGKYGYISIPAMPLITDKDSLHQFTQPMYDSIALLAEQGVDQWIIDLRFNTGGNMWPMIGSVYNLLGDGKFASSINHRKQDTVNWQLKNGILYEGQDTITYIERQELDMSNDKVAIITGKVTASSGEILALAFKERGNTIFIGEPTMGLTTTNQHYELPFEVYLELTEGIDADRLGNYYERIEPDTTVSKRDNFEDYLEDENIKAAIEFFKK